MLSVDTFFDPNKPKPSNALHFTGVEEFFEPGHTGKMRESSKAMHKPATWRDELSGEALTKLERLLAHEIDLYKFARALFFKKYQYLKSGKLVQYLLETKLVKANHQLAKLL